MILIADSGSTKTDWILIENKIIKSIFTSIGLNPYFISSNEIAEHLKKSIPTTINLEQIKNIYFYGAGCSTKEKSVIVETGLKTTFINSEFLINTDLLASARALFGNNSGIIGILGTGSNSGYYDGNIIMNNIPGYGYILGDEGSGAVLGMEFIKAYLHNELPLNIKEIFFNYYNLSVSDILDNVYKKPLPNRFFASFGKFLHSNLDNEYISKLVKDCFDKFFDKYICKYNNYKNYPIKFSGSIAYNFKQILYLAASDRNLIIDEIIEHPISRLAKYHTK